MPKNKKQSKQLQQSNLPDVAVRLRDGRLSAKCETPLPPLSKPLLQIWIVGLTPFLLFSLPDGLTEHAMHAITTAF